MNISNSPIEGTLTGTTTADQSGPESNGNEVGTPHSSIPKLKPQASSSDVI